MSKQIDGGLKITSKSVVVLYKSANYDMNGKTKWVECNSVHNSEKEAQGWVAEHSTPGYVGTMKDFSIHLLAGGYKVKAKVEVEKELL
jgi:hypothetical protein